MTLNSLRFYFTLCALLVASAVSADVPVSQKHEVEHLLSFVKETACLLERNGKKHVGKKAVAHIQKKYDYFRDEITSTEAFIEYSATKSTMSGKYYQVYCPGLPPLKTKEWLLAELLRYRSR